MNKYKQYFNCIYENRYKLFKLLRYFNEQNDVQRKLSLADDILIYLQTHSCGIYRAKTLENFYIDIAKNINVDLKDIPFEKNSFLHVMTRALPIGGHTRVVERWIDQANDDEHHDVVLLDQGSTQIPNILGQNVMMQQGELLRFDETLSIIDRAILLRKCAMKYQYVILHVNPEDPMALIAFGTEQFKRPIILYNHADYAFWCGVSIADVIADLGRNGEQRSLEKRGAKNTFVLGIPLDLQKETIPEKAVARTRLNISQDSQIIFISGNQSKLTSLGGDSITSYIHEILAQNNAAICYALGPNNENPDWKRLKDQWNNRLIFLANVDYNRGYWDYIASADLILDSYPIPGGTTILDACMVKRPVLSLKSEIKQCDYLIDSENYCQTGKDLVAKSGRILNDHNYAKKLSENLYEKMISFHGKEAWNKHKNELIKALPNEHSLNQIPFYDSLPKVDDEDVLIAIWHRDSNIFLFKREIFSRIKHMIKTYIRNKKINKMKLF